MSLSLLAVANLGSVRWAKSSQGNRRGTCGWITSFFILFLKRMATLTLFFSIVVIAVADTCNGIHNQIGPVVKPGITAPLHSFCKSKKTGAGQASGSKRFFWHKLPKIRELPDRSILQSSMHNG